MKSQQEPRVRITDENGRAYEENGKLLGKLDSVTGELKRKPRYERVQGLLVMVRKAEPRAARKTAKLCV
jgi:hypothetical protein